MEYTPSTARARRSSWFMLVAIGMFVLGALLAGYGVWRYGDDWLGKAEVPAGAVPGGPGMQRPSSPAPRVTASAAAQEAVEAAQIVAEQQGGLDQRLAAAEQRIARLDLQAEAASGNVARAEGLLIAFAARRAIERGDDLGYLGDQLRLRFGDAMPNAVRTLAAFARQPVTVDQLVARLDGLAPELTQDSRQFSWRHLGDEFSRLFVVRRESTPSPQPRRRIERARLFLKTGRVEAAVAEVRNLPGGAGAQSWIRDAERYAAAQEALEMIETAAVLEPRKLRDGQGRLVEQSSPVAEGALIPTPTSPGSGAQ